VYPLHAGDPASLREAIDTMRKTHATVEAIGLGSLAPIAAKNTARVLKVVELARQLLPGKWLHVFGVGGSTLAALALSGLADSVDTASHLVDAKFGMVRDPRTMRPVYVAPRKNRKRVEVDIVASVCECPVCRAAPNVMREWSREGFKARALHNAYWLLESVARPEVAERWPRVSVARVNTENLTCIVSCGKEKDSSPQPAGRLYRGRYFRSVLRAAYAICGARTLILSSKYGLITPWTVIEPYDMLPGDRDAVKPEQVQTHLPGTRILPLVGKRHARLLGQGGWNGKMGQVMSVLNRVSDVGRSLSRGKLEEAIDTVSSHIYMDE